MQKLACPKCHLPLILENKTYKCQKNHCYDLAKRGYINLLLNPDKATNNPGDSKESLIARKAYLNKGYYDVILNQVIHMIEKYKTQDCLNILDLGCGEGYYTHRIKEHFDNSDIYGLDISKIAIDMATRYRKDVTWIVGNSKNIPIQDHSLDFVTALFTVVNKDELKRILKEKGYIIHVTANS
ncbi:MAG: methyltransferase domain-containing protein, partial [Faecalibacillus sp.]